MLLLEKNSWKWAKILTKKLFKSMTSSSKKKIKKQETNIKAQINEMENKHN